MTFVLGSTSLSRSKHVDQRLLDVVSLGLSISTVDAGFSEEQSRTAAQQQKKFDTGVSKVKPGPAATHMIQDDGFSKAVDLVPWIDGRFQWGDANWQVRNAEGHILNPIFDLAAAMRNAAIVQKVRLRWGGIWDRVLNDLPGTAAELMRELDAYKVRHAGPDFLDGPHYELHE
jgi:peptidoglycan L-alanyl-D-glutamate endopeptidase CwlK